jgi:hypothetical protein
MGMARRLYYSRAAIQVIFFALSPFSSILFALEELMKQELYSSLIFISC